MVNRPSGGNAIECQRIVICKVVKQAINWQAGNQVSKSVTETKVSYTVYLECLSAFFTQVSSKWMSTLKAGFWFR